MSDLEWVGPDLPAKPPSRADRVAAELRERPGEWAKIDTHEGAQLLPWYGPLLRHDDYEVETRRTRAPGRNESLLFGGGYTIWARYVGGED